MRQCRSQVQLPFRDKAVKNTDEQACAAQRSFSKRSLRCFLKFGSQKRIHEVILTKETKQPQPTDQQDKYLTYCPFS